MANNGKPTGNEVASSDFARLLLAVKDSALRDTHCLELAIVKEIEGSRVLCKIISNPDLMIQATRINNMSLNVNQIVLVGFNDNDFKSNLNKYLTNDLTLQESVNKNRHILTNGIIITNFTEGGSDFSGSYNDLTNKPILNTTNAESLTPSPNENIQGTMNLHKISKTGSYEDLLNKPVIPEADSDLVNNRYVRYDINNQSLTNTEKLNARTNIDAYSKPSGGIPDSDLAEDYIKQGDTLTKPLTVTGGDSANAGKIILDQTGSGQITDLTTRTLLGFLNAVDLTVGNAAYNLKLRGLQTRPTYNGNDLALLSDIQVDSNTWRNILVNDNEILGTGTNTGALNLKQGSNVTITNNNGDVTIESSDTGATKLRGYTFTSVLVNDYVNFTTTDEYVNLYVYISDVLTAVTSSNKDSLNIVPGTTQAYFYTNGFSGNFGNEYLQSSRTISMTNNAKFITGNDVENQLNINSIFPVQNKVIAKLIMSGTSSNNKLANVDFVNSSINALAAFFITKDAQGDNFNTYAELIAATTFYSGGSQRIPTTNDYTYIRWDETKGDVVSGYSSFTTTAEYIGHFVIYNNEGVEVTLANKDSVGITPGTTIAYDNLPTTRYSYQGGVYPVGQWDFQLIVNNSALTAAQIAALNSGITSALVNQIVTNQSNITSLQNNTLTNVSYNSSTKKLQQTKNGTTSDIVQFGDNAFNSDTIPTEYLKNVVGYMGGQAEGYTLNLSFERSFPYNSRYFEDLQFQYGDFYLNSIISTDRIKERISISPSITRQTNLFPAFSTSSTYDIGDIVVYNNLYYICNTSIITPGSWDSSKWTQSNLMDLFDTKQNILVSGVNIKTINGNSILGSGDITIQGGGGTQVSVAGVDVNTLAFTSDPQTQINTINSTLSSKANDNEVVHKTGTETISGYKTFTSTSGVRIGTNGPRLVYNSTYQYLGIIF